MTLQCANAVSTAICHVLFLCVFGTFLPVWNHHGQPPTIIKDSWSHDAEDSAIGAAATSNDYDVTDAEALLFALLAKILVVLTCNAIIVSL